MSAPPVNGGPRTSARAPRDGCAIYVLVDALGWEILRSRPFLDDVLVERRPMETVLGYSSAAIPSLLSGRLPSVHGHWNLFYYSPATSPFRWAKALRVLPDALVENRVSRRVLKEVGRRVSGYRGYFAIYNFPMERLRFFDLCERGDIYEPGGLEGTPSIFDVFHAERLAYECFTYHRYSDAETLDAVPARLRTSDARVYFLYLSQFDAYLHFHVSEPAGVTEKLRWYEDGLRRVVRAATERWGSARVYVFSDHGMTPVARTCDLGREIKQLGLAIPDEVLPVFDSTMARFWVRGDRARDRLVSFLGRHPSGRLLADQELRDLGIWFDDARYGELVFLLEPGTIIVPSDMGRIRFGGMHGYHPTDPTTTAVLLSTERLPAKATHITDVFDVVLGDLGLDASSPRTSLELLRR